jgi:hypothetical protein
MARDEAARDSGPGRPLVDRHSYRRPAGVAAEAITVAGASGDAAEPASPGLIPRDV